MGILSQDRPPIPQGSQPRWERCERADLVAQSREVRTQGLAARHAAHTLQGPCPTRPAWRLGPATLARCPPVAAGVQSGPGRACFPRWVRAFHLACGAVGACGRRLGWLVRTLTGLDRVGAAASGAHQPVHAQGAHASVPDRPSAACTPVQGPAPHRPHGAPGRALARGPVPRHHGPGEPRHAGGPGRSRPRAHHGACVPGASLDAAHGPGDPRAP